MEKKQSEMTGKEIILQERQRQISQEGWTAEHDDQHVNGELEKAANCYYEFADDDDYTDTKVHEYWPWEASWWKPKSQLEDYKRAGALYRAEMERLERKGGLVGQKLTDLRIGIRQCEIKIDEILSHEAYIRKKADRESPRVTSNKVLNYQPLYELLKTHGLNDLVDCELDEIIDCVKSLSLPLTGTAEEAANKYAEKLDPNSTGKQMMDTYKAFLAGAQWQASTQSTTIERLTKALEDIAEEDTRSFAGFTKEQLIDIAREALNSIKK
jgi:hypothetical protein